MDNILNVKNMINIKVIGIGGAGNNAVNRMIEDGIDGVEFYELNTEVKVFEDAKTKNTMQIGKEITKGLGAGGDVSIGEKAVLENKEEIKNILQGTDLLFLTAGMGGGTGTGAIPAVAQIAKEMGILTVGIVSKPFSFEGRIRMAKAERGINELRENVNSLIVVLNDNLLKTNKRITLENAFKEADLVLEKGIKGITDQIATPGLVNIDFADIRTIIGYKGNAYMGIGRGKGDNRNDIAVKEAIGVMLELAKSEQEARERNDIAVKEAIGNPLTETTMQGAKGVIVNIAGSAEMPLDEINAIMTVIGDRVDNPEANIIFGTIIDDSLQDEIVITVIATGIEK